jgi:GTP-dependent phosphoenolpyruvate carboxykinase
MTLLLLHHKIKKRQIKKIKDTDKLIIVIYTISGIKAILQDSSVKIADDEGVSPSSSVITRVSCNML